MSFLCNQIMRTVCPCFFNKKRNLTHYGDNELIERQQFINVDSIDHDYDIKHQANKQLKSEQYTKTSEHNSSRQQEEYSQQEQLSRELSRTNSGQNIQVDSLLEQQVVYHDYTDTIAADNPYYDILYPKLQILSSLFDVDQKYRLEITESPFPVKMYCKQSQVRKTNIFIYSFEFENTTYQSYESLLNNFQIQKTFDANIDDYYKKVQSPNNDTKIIYLSYHKVLIVAPRDFIYARYVFKKGKQFWSIATSIPNQQQTPGKIRGEIVLTATKVIERQNRITVQVYSQVNMKMGIKPEMAKNRGKTQIKKYLEKCHKYLSENPNDQKQSII